METHKLNYAYPACPPVWYCAPYSGRKDEQIKISDTVKNIAVAFTEIFKVQYCRLSCNTHVKFCEGTDTQLLLNYRTD